MKNFLIVIFLSSFLFFSNNEATSNEMQKKDLNIEIFPSSINGIDQVSDWSKNIKDKRIGLLTNNASKDLSGRNSPEAILEAGLNLTALYVPEHGFFTSVKAGVHVKDDFLFGVPVYSLYGSNRRPSKEYLDKCDIVVIDIQDIGIRSYTYISTIYNVLDAAAEYGKKVIVLDRENPLGDHWIDGNVAEEDKLNFVSRYPIPYIHGMTVAELCIMANEEGWLPNKRKCDLEVIPVLERYGFREPDWIPTSPHIPTINAVRGAATLGIIGELGVISIGIGTTLPFQYLGAPDFNSDKFIEALQQYYPEKVKETESNVKLEGVILQKTRFQPFYGMYSNKECKGFLLKFELSTSKNSTNYFSAGIGILFALKVSHPHYFNDISDRAINMFKKVTGTDSIWNSLELNSPYIFKNAKSGQDDFLKLRNKYLLYERYDGHKY